MNGHPQGFPTIHHNPRPARWPQFSLRWLWIVLTLSCVFLGWLGAQLKWIHDRHEALRWIQKYPTAVCDERSGLPAKPYPWGLRALGESPLYALVGIEPQSPADRELAYRFEKLFPESHIVIGQIDINRKTGEWTLAPFVVGEEN